MTSYFTNNWNLKKTIFTKTIYSKNKKLNEYPSLDKFKSFRNLKLGIELCDNEILKNNWKNEQEQMTAYNELYDLKSKCFKVLVNLPDHKWGRNIPSRSLSLSVMHRSTRHAFCKDVYIDIDMKNAQPHVLLQIIKLNNERAPFLEDYCNNRDEYLELIMKNHNTTRDNAKRLLIRITMGGSYNEWKKENYINIQEKKIQEENPELKQKADIKKRHAELYGKSLEYPEWTDAMKKENNLQKVEDFNNEMKRFRDIVYAHNEHIIDDIIKANPNKFDEFKTDYTILQAKKRTCISLWCQTIERYIQEKVISYLVANKGFKLIDIVPCQDGFMILKELNYQGIIDECESVIKQAIGFDVYLIEKPFNEAMHIPIDMVAIDTFIEGQYEESEKADQENECSSAIIFKKLVPEFEKNHAKIINRAFYVKKTEDEIIIMSKTQLCTAYEHIQCGISRNKLPVSFISKWISYNDKIRKFDDIGTYPKENLCPKNIFNMWIPFEMEDSKKPWEYDEAALQKIIKHIKILCDNDEIVSDYFIKWIAQMVQYPEVKSITPTIISEQGAGKGTLIKLFIKMFGNKKVMESTDPGRDCWGDFNGLMKDAFLVNLNELSKKDTMDTSGKLKALITDPTIMINMKGINQYSLQSYHRILITTNSNDPIATSKYDRRNMIIRASDELVGSEPSKREYFTDFNKNVIENFNAVKTFYEYLKKIPDMDKFKDIPIPKTAHQEELKTLSISSPESWLMYFTQNNYDEDIIEISPKNIFENFVEWCTMTNTIYNINSQKLGVKLSLIKSKYGVLIEKGKHTAYGDLKIFHISKLKQHFEMGCLII